MLKNWVAMFVVFGAFVSQVVAQNYYWVEGEPKFSLTLTYTDYSTIKETSKPNGGWSYSIKSKKVRITNKTLISLCGAELGIEFSNRAKLRYDYDMCFYIDDPTQGSHYVDNFISIVWGPFSASSLTESEGAGGKNFKSSGKGKWIATITFNFSSLEGNLRGVDTSSCKGYRPIDDINWDNNFYYVYRGKITTLGGDEVSMGVIEGPMSFREKLFKLKVQQ